MSDYFGHIEFANPVYLYLLLIIPLLIVWYIFMNFKSFAEIQFSSFAPFKNVKKTLKQKMYHSLFVLRILVIALLIIVLARPQSSLSKKMFLSKGLISCWLMIFRAVCLLKISNPIGWKLLVMSVYSLSTEDPTTESVW